MMPENTHFPALPDYTGPTSGWFGLVHHDILFEYSNNIMERVEFYDNGGKPANELETRRRCLVWIDPAGLPERAQAEYDKALAEYDKALAEYDKAWAEYSKAWAEYSKAIKLYSPQIEAEIRRLVPDLPWNGRELVFQKEALT